MRLLEFTYNDAEGNIHHRVVEPYAHGVTRQGNEALRAYQIGGTSETEVPGWRLFLVGRMFGLRMSESSFAGTVPGYAHGDRALNPVHCRVP